MRYLLLSCLICVCIYAQPSGMIKGSITDETGAVVPGAKVTATGPGGTVKATTSGPDGSYTLSGLQQGSYSLEASSPGLQQLQPTTVEVGETPVTANLPLRVVLEKQEVTVQENTGPQVSVDPSQNAGALVLRGADLDALSDDPDDLQADLQALAGPSAGPNGGQIYIDGFTGGVLPNKNSIREIRINQNPFSPEYDKIGFGRIEILTKPGTDKLRGQMYFNYGNDIFNSRNPFASVKAPFDLKEFGGNISGPLSKKASYFLDVDDRLIDNSGIVNAISPVTLLPYNAIQVEPFRRLRVSPRLDYQLTPNNTLTVRYAYTRNNASNQGIGGFNLLTRGYNQKSLDDTVQVTETAVINPKVINETRFQYLHDNTTQGALSVNQIDLYDGVTLDYPFSITVPGSFGAGASNIGSYAQRENHYEVQNYTSIASGVHAWKFGVRLRAVSLQNFSEQNFNGTYTFASLAQYEATLAAISAGAPLSLLPAGIGPTQFLINRGNPLVHVGQYDLGLFVGDDWRVRPNLTLSLGLRYETQANINDHNDWAPRIGFAWAPGSSAKGAPRPKTVLRGGFGIFYDRISEMNVLTAERLNGLNQEQLTVVDPNFFGIIPNLATLTTTSSAVYRLSPTLRAPYVIQSAIGVERQLPKNTTIAFNYTNTHGLHELLSRNINAPLPGTFTGVRGSGVFPYGNVGPIYEIESAGLYNQNQYMVNVNSRVNQNISLFGFYVLNFAHSNTDGVNTFPANQYNMAGEYGPASTDIRHRVNIGGNLATKWGIRLNPFITVQSGMPYNITTGQDVYGSTVLSARPGIVTNPSECGAGLNACIQTPYGLLDPNPYGKGEQILPRNFGRGPAQFFINMRLSRTFGFGQSREGAPNGGFGRGGGGGGPRGPIGGGFGGMRGGGGPRGGPGGPGGFGGPGASASRRYNLTVSLSARNLLNHVNEGPIVGNIQSPLFGHANSLAGGLGAFAENANNRRIEAQIRFQF